MQRSWPWLAVVGAPLWVLLVWIRHLAAGARRWRILHVLVVLLGSGILLGLFWGSYRVGKITATAEYQVQMNQDYPDYPRVRVELKGTKSGGTSASPQPSVLAEGCYRLLLQNRDKIFLFYSFNSDIPPATLPVVVVPVAEMSSMRILPHYRSCAIVTKGLTCPV